jgi:hypothetical protein
MLKYPPVKVEKNIIQVEVERVERKEKQIPTWVIKMYEEAGLFDKGSIFCNLGSRRR